MRKKLIAFIIVMMVVINLVAGTLLFLNIQLMEAPEVTIHVDVIEVNSEEAVIQATIDVANPNSFGLITKNLELFTVTSGGDEIAHVLIEGGDVPPRDSRMFAAAVVIAFDGYSTGVITNKVTGEIGVSVGFIRKTIPFVINIVTSLEDVIKELAPPNLRIEADFRSITREGINVIGIIEAYNPNTFGMYLGNILVEIENEAGKNLGHLDIPGGTIAARSSLKLDVSGRILAEALNAKALLVSMSGKAGAKIVGVNKSISFSTKAKIKIPDLGSLISLDSPTDVVIRGDFRASLDGLVDEIALEVYNPNKINLIATDVMVSIYLVYDDEKRLIGECELEEGIIEPENVTILRGSTTIPYSKLLPPRGERFIPDAMIATVRANVTIPGVNQSIWIGLSGYQDFRLFR